MRPLTREIAFLLRQLSDVIYCRLFCNEIVREKLNYGNGGEEETSSNGIQECLAFFSRFNHSLVSHDDHLASGSIGTLIDRYIQKNVRRRDEAQERMFVNNSFFVSISSGHFPRHRLI